MRRIQVEVLDARSLKFMMLQPRLPRALVETTKETFSYKTFHSMVESNSRCGS